LFAEIFWVAMFELKHIDKSFRDREDIIHVARDLSWCLGPGESVALMGESGAGKTTLMNIIAGLETLDAGEVWVDGVQIAELNQSELTAFRRDHIGLIFQKFHLVPSLSAWDNAALQARLAGVFDRDFARSLFDRLGIDHLVHRRPSQLSGGQQQRVAIARALMHRPKLVLADEPTGSLDEATSSAVIELLVGAASDAGATLVVVTHSSAIASHLGHVVRLGSGALTPVS
jgi:putative ABC transport system ATP-binding protein